MERGREGGKGGRGKEGGELEEKERLCPGEMMCLVQCICIYTTDKCTCIRTCILCKGVYFLVVY